MRLLKAINIVFIFLILTAYSQTNNFNYNLKDTLGIIRIKELNTFSVDSLNIKQNLKVEPEINKTALYGLFGLYSAYLTASYIYYKNTWWEKNSPKFSFVDDWDYSLWVDKIGHFYGTHFQAHFITASLETANISLEKSYVYGAIGSMLLQTFVEINDGFGPSWGFSRGDYVFNILGAAFYIAQYYFPPLLNIQPKMSYWPTDQLKRDADRTVANDYEGQMNYLSFRIKEILPENISKYWPGFFTIAIGYGIRNWSGYKSADEVYTICLDYDFDKIPLQGKFWQFIKNTLNYIHFPAPGIKFIKNKIYFALVY